MQDKHSQLKRAKQNALICLLIAAGVFVSAIVTQVYVPSLASAKWLGLIKMASEAALVGGLADWFAVTALFKPIPARYPIPHTNIVASNKKVIAQNLSQFVKEKFFHASAIETLIASSQPAKGAGRWLEDPQHAKKLSRFLCDAIAGILRLVDDKPVKAFIGRTAEKGINQLDLQQLIATVLSNITRERHHQLVLDKLLGNVAKLMGEPETQEYIAATLIDWLKTEHNRLEKLLPSTWLSERGALIAVKAVSRVLDDVYADDDHPLRHAFDEQVNDFLHEVQTSESMAQRINNYKEQLVHDPALKVFLNKSWGALHGRMLESLTAESGKAETKVTHWLNELGHSLTTDERLSSAFDRHIGEAGKYMAPELADFLTKHIEDTINSWDENEMAEQIELNIGRDLQKVRINGTLVGGLIGALLFGLEQVIAITSQ